MRSFAADALRLSVATDGRYLRYDIQSKNRTFNEIQQIQNCMSFSSQLPYNCAELWNKRSKVTRFIAICETGRSSMKVRLVEIRPVSQIDRS